MVSMVTLQKCYFLYLIVCILVAIEELIRSKITHKKALRNLIKWMYAIGLVFVLFDMGICFCYIFVAAFYYHMPKDGVLMFALSMIGFYIWLITYLIANYFIREEGKDYVSEESDPSTDQHT